VKKHPAYFDSQQSASAALKIDISDLREAKRQGCPGFRSGRVYTGELLEWLAKHMPRALKKRRAAESSWMDPANTGDERTDRALDVCKAITALTNLANRGLIADDRYIEIGTEIVSSVTDEFKKWPEAKPLLEEWTEKAFGYLFHKFGDENELKAALLAHPKIVSWLSQVTGTEYVEQAGKKHHAD
jgi:hypothetical protein